MRGAYCDNFFTKKSQRTQVDQRDGFNLNFALKTTQSKVWDIPQLVFDEFLLEIGAVLLHIEEGEERLFEVVYIGSINRVRHNKLYNFNLLLRRFRKQNALSMKF